MVPVAQLPPAVVRGALRALGEQEVPPTRAAAVRRLRQLLGTVGVVRDLLDRAPPEVRRAFLKVATDGPAQVEQLLGRGWWGHGLLPPPLDWAQQRALLAVADGLVHPVAEARAALLEPGLPLALEPDEPDATAAHRPVTAPAREPATTAPAGTAAADRPATEARPATAPPDAHAAAPDAGVGESLRVEPARAVVVAATPAALDRALTVPGADLRAVAPTVAWSPRSAVTVRAALRAAGIVLDADAVVSADPGAPALPGVSEEAVGPRAVRALLQRAVAEGRQVRLEYYASSRGGAATDRVVDPWSFADDLLRGWCHLRTDERTFALDRVGRATLLPTPVEHAPPS